MTEHDKFAYIPVGLPAAGKTTFGNRLVECHDGDLLSLGPDDVREHLYPGYSKGLIPFEDMDLGYTFEVAESWAEDILRNGYSLWWDAVNTNAHHRSTVVRNCRRWGAKLVGLELTVPFDVIVERNERVREGHRRPPLSTLEMMHKQMLDEPLSVKEGFWEVWRFEWDGELWRYRGYEAEGGHYGSMIQNCYLLDDFWMD